MDDRNKVRRQLAQGSMLLAFAIVISVLWCLSSDALAARLEKVWPPLVVIFPALIVQIGHYIQVGSSETKEAMKQAGAQDAKGAA